MSLLMREEVFRLVGAAMVVLNEVGHVLHEKPYENALVVELGLQRIPYEQQRCFPVVFKGVQISQYVSDLIAFSGLMIDAKVIEKITDHERGQMLNYLRISKMNVGLILNFKRAKLEWERIVLSDHSR
jgi:GxxExxY protein